MDLRAYLGPLRRNIWLIILIGLIAGAAAWLVSANLSKPSYTGELYITIAYTDDQPSPDYKYGNYYANFASIEFARTMSAWTSSGVLVDKIYLDAHVDQASDLDLLGRLFGAISMKRLERANILYTFRSKSQANADRLLAALRTNLASELTAYNQASATRYAMINPQARVLRNEPRPLFAGILGLCVGLVFGILLAYLIEYGRRVLMSSEQAGEQFGTAPDFVVDRSDPDMLNLLAAHLARLDAAPVLVGVDLDPSGLAQRLGSRLQRLRGRVTLIEGEPRLGLSRRLSLSGKGLGWSDETHPGKGPVKPNQKLAKAVGTDVQVIPFGRTTRASLSRLLQGAPATTIGVTSFPRGAGQLIDLAPHTPLVVVAQIGRSSQRDLAHVRSFVQDRPHTLVLLT